MKGLNTRLIHGDEKDSYHSDVRSLKMPVFQTAAYDFEDSASVERAFRGESDSFVYSRISNPTVRELEVRLKSLANAQSSLSVSSGMAAISSTILSICDTGDNIVASKYLFGNTYSFFTKTLSSFGIQVKFVDPENPDEVELSIDAQTRAIFLEVITNPQLIVFDFERISQIAKEKKVLLILDNSLLTPYLFQSHQYGVDIEVLSTTKFISGGATSIGGAVFTYPSDKWQYIPKLQENYQLYGNAAFEKKLRKELFSNLGCCLSPQNAWLQMLGLETLTLRVDRICENAHNLASWLSEQDKVQRVEYSSLEKSPYYQLSEKYFTSKVGCLIAIELKSKKQCFDFMDALKVIRRGTNFCDNKSMIIHPSSTIYCDLSDEAKESFKIPDTLIRLGVGLEDIEDLKTDIQQALDKLK